MHEDLYISIIQKKLSGEISPSETAMLEQWLREDPDHQLLANSIEKAWELGGNFNVDVDVDLDTDFATLEKKMAREESGKLKSSSDNNEAEVVPMKPRRKGLSIAAAIAILVVAGFLINHLLSPKTEWQFAENTSDEIQRISLSDGSEVKLSKNSTLKYPETFIGKTRNLELSGEAFFEVKRNAELPFVVSTKNGTVTVLGTTFKVRDFEQEPDMQVLVNSGKVKMEVLEGSESLILEKAEQGVLNKKAKELTESQVPSLNELARYTKQLTFVNMPLEQVINDLENYYGVQILNRNEDLLDCPFTNTFKDKSIDIVLETIKTVYGLDIEIINATTYGLSGGSCR